MYSPRIPEVWLLLVASLGVTLTTPKAAADARYWVGPVGGLWSNPANWSATPGGPGGAGVPQVLDAAVAPSGISAHFDHFYAQPGIGTESWSSPVFVEQDVPSSVLVAITDLTLPRFQSTGGTGVGRYIQTAGSAILNTNLRLGQEQGNVQGFYTLSGGATLSIGSSLFARNGVFTQTGGTCTITGYAELGTLFAPTQGGIQMNGGVLSIADGISQHSGASTFSGGQTTIGAAISILDGASTVLSGGNLSVGSVVLNFPSAQMLHNSGVLETPNQIEVQSTAVYRYNGGELSVGSVDIKSGGLFLMGLGANKVARTKGIVTTGTGKMDLADNAATVDYTGSSPLTSIRSQIVSAYNGGSWNGSGIGSSMANSTQRGVGYAEASALSAIPSIFGSVDNDTVLIRLARYGDADLSGFVNLDDFNRLAANFGAGDVWTEADFNYDGMTNLSDFNLLAANFGKTASPGGPTPADWAALASAVPEPSITGFLIGALALLPRRRRS